MTDAGDGTDKRGQPDLEAVFADNYLPIQYAYVQFLAEHLVDCRKSFGGDLDDMMLLAVLGQRMISVKMEAGATAVDEEDRFWMSALRLSDVTFVPRETVRRKLIRLQAKGWVLADPVKGWRIAGTPGSIRARLDLTELDLRGRDRLLRLVGTILRYVPAARTKD